MVGRRPLLLLPVLAGALALPATPALAGEDDGDSGSAKLRATQGCVSGNRAKAVVTGDDIDSVVFYVDGERIKRLTGPNSGDRFVFTMKCSRLDVGAHRASAVVTSSEGSRRALRFQITRAAQVSPQYTG
jgi:hypothetical protein